MDEYFIVTPDNRKTAGCVGLLVFGLLSLFLLWSFWPSAPSCRQGLYSQQAPEKQHRLRSGPSLSSERSSPRGHARQGVKTQKRQSVSDMALRHASASIEADDVRNVLDAMHSDSPRPGALSGSAWKFDA